MPADIPTTAAGQVGWAADERRFKVFVSYSRRDGAELAQRLVSQLEGLGLAARIDARDLEFGVLWQQQLKDFIRQADAVVFVVSPGSVSSKWCRWEVAQVAAQSKRLVPVVHLDVSPEELPAELSEIQLFLLRRTRDYRTDKDFEGRCVALAEGLQRDRDWLQEHTRLIELAHAWRLADHAPDRLLRGTALRDAERWMAARTKTAPEVGQAHLEFIGASQLAAKRRARRWTLGLAALAVGMLALSSVAILQWREATVQQGIAEDKTEEALTNLNNALTNESRLMARLANGEMESGDTATAMALAIEALPSPDAPANRPLVPEAATALAAASAGLRELAVMHLDGLFFSPALSPKGEFVATGSDMRNESDRLARVYNAADGRLIKELGGFDDPVHFVSFNADGSLLLTLDNRRVRVWRTTDWTAVAEARWEGGGYIFTAAFSDDFERIWVGAEDGGIGVWNWKGPATFQTVGKHAALIGTILVSAFSNYVAVLSEDGALSFWKGRTLERLSNADLRIADPDSGQDIPPLCDLVFSLNGDRLISMPRTTFKATSARIWNVVEGTLEGEVSIEEYKFGQAGQAQDLGFASAAFIDEQAMIATIRDDGAVRFTYRGDEVTLRPPNGKSAVGPSTFALEGNAFVSAGAFGAGADEYALYAWYRNRDLGKWQPAPVVMAGHSGMIEQYVVRDYVYRPGEKDQLGGFVSVPEDVLKLLSVGNDGTIRIWSTRPPAPDTGDTPPARPDWTTANVLELIRAARAAAPRCLTPEQRRSFLLPDAPPRWCITGGGLEAETDPGKWAGKWPYHTEAWRTWLAASDRGDKLPMPTTPPAQ